MKNIFNKLSLSIGFAISLASCSDKPELYEEIKTCESYLIKTNKGYFLKGGEFDFMTDEKHAKRFNGDNSAVVKYKIIYEIIENGSVDEYGNKIDRVINKSRELLDVWPKEKK